MTRITPSSLDLMLADALRADATAAPMPDTMLRVPDRWVRGRRSVRPTVQAIAVGGVAIAAMVVTLAVLNVVGALGERGPSIGSEDAPDIGVPIESLDVEPRPGQVPEMGEPAIGPVVEVARGRVEGRAFRYTVYRGARPSDVCIQFEWLPSAGGACGPMPGAGGSYRMFGVGSSSHASTVTHEVLGLVDPTVSEVWVETDAGGKAQAQLVPLSSADIDALLFFAFLPGGVDSRPGSRWMPPATRLIGSKRLLGRPTFLAPFRRPALLPLRRRSCDRRTPRRAWADRPVVLACEWGTLR
ncbi:MAG: hypothetical protein WKH68_08310 [Candidatus Limnocylindria bacterium]